MINSVNSNNVSFGGIVRVKVFKDGVFSSDSKVIDSALRKFKRVLLKQADTPENTAKLSKIREAYHALDADYFIPAKKVTGESRSFLTRIRNKFKYFIVSGKDAEKLSDAGRDIGKTNKFLELDFGTRNGAVSEGRNLVARSNYTDLKDDIAVTYASKKIKPEITLYTVSNPKSKNGGIELSSISFYPKIKKQAPKKYVQTNFMNALFSQQK